MGLTFRQNFNACNHKPFLFKNAKRLTDGLMERRGRLDKTHHRPTIAEILLVL